MIGKRHRILAWLFSGTLLVWALLPTLQFFCALDHSEVSDVGADMACGSDCGGGCDSEGVPSENPHKPVHDERSCPKVCHLVSAVPMATPDNVLQHFQVSLFIGLQENIFDTVTTVKFTASRLNDLSPPHPDSSLLDQKTLIIA